MSTPPTAAHAFDAAHAEAYDRNLERILPIKDTLHLLLRWHLAGLPDHARVLVVGAGTGAEARFLAPLYPGWRFTLVDPSEAMLEVARRHATAEGFADRCTFHPGLVSSVEDGRFDAASSVLVSHFLTSAADRQAYYAEIAARLAPGGLLFEAALCADTDHPTFGALMDLWLAVAGMPDDRRASFRAAFGKGLAAHGPAEVEGMLAGAGFTAPAQCFQAAIVRGWIARR